MNALAKFGDMLWKLAAIKVLFLTVYSSTQTYNTVMNEPCLYHFTTILESLNISLAPILMSTTTQHIQLPVNVIHSGVYYLLVLCT